MITIKQDSELMTNYIPANPVPAGNRFVGIKDAHSRPACFSLSSDKKLNLIIQSDDAATLVDFGELAGIHGDVQAFNVQQSPNSDLSLCVATDEGNGTSSFWFLDKLHPRNLTGNVPKDRIVKGNGLPSIHHLFMSNFGTDGSTSTPLVFAAFQPTDRITSEQQLGFVNVAGSTVKLDTSWSLSTNPEKIIDIAFGTCDLGDGLFVLYEVGDKTKIQFKIFQGDGDDFVVEPKCPPGVRSIATFMDPELNESVLITGGDVLSSHSSDQYLSTQNEGDIIASSMNIKDLHIAQADGELRIWYTTLASSVHYYTCKTSALSKGTTTPLLPKGRAGRISPLLAAHGSGKATSYVLSVGKSGNLTLLQQDPATKIWQNYPFYHASATNLTEVKGYTLRIQAKSDQTSGDGKENERALIPNCWLRLYSSGTIRCLVNGLETELSRDGSWFRTDMEGTLHVIFETSDASCHKVFVDCFCAGTSSPRSPSDLRVLSTPPLNPSAKVIAKLSNIKSGDDLLAARTQNGERVLGQNVSKADADKAASAIAMLVGHLDKVDVRDTRKFAAHMSSLRMAQKTNLLAFQPLQLSIWDDIVDAGSEAWNWVKDRVEDVVDWACDVVDRVIDRVEEAVGKVVQMTINLGNEVYKFVLDSVTTIATGISWVFEKLGAALDKLIEWVGFLFQWDDILTTTDSLVTIFNAGLDYGQLKVGALEEKAKTWIGETKTEIKDALARIRSQNQDELSQVSKSDVSSKSDNPMEDSVAFNWVGYQIQHGGVVTNATITPPAGGGDTNDKVIAEIWDEFKNQFKVAENFVRNLSGDFIDLIKSNTWDDVTTVLSKFTDDLIDLIMDTLGNATGVILKIVRLGIGTVKSLGNFEIECPVITQLWKLATGGRPLTLFNFCALLISIPTTIIQKAVTGKKPAALKGRLTGDTFGQFLENGTVRGDSNLPGDIRALVTPAIVTTVFLSSRVTALGLIWESVSGGFDSSLMKLPVTTSMAKLSLASPIRPRLKLAGKPGGGLPVDKTPNTPWYQNVFDVIALVFETGGLIFSWPPSHMNADYVQWVDVFRWSIWLADLTNDAAIVITRAIGGVKDLERHVTKWWRAIITMVTTTPKFLMELAIVFNDYIVRNETVPALIRHIVEAVLALAGDLGFIVAAATDEVKGAEEFFYSGVGVFVGCSGVRAGLKLVDYALEDHKAES
ncbi:hypothetical protein F5Y06DRAFT_258371 [Hypoxylon sp. FL0890]|nr:hypothetical protein F5Y06DRAFT_258371 [Hypoxylon sp. FL0890]